MNEFMCAFEPAGERPAKPTTYKKIYSVAVNGNRHDNIEVLASQAEHARIHSTGRKHTPEAIQKMKDARKRKEDRRT